MNNELFLNGIQDLLSNHLTEWTSVIQEYGINLFMILATISLIVNIILIQTESASGIDTNKILGFLIRFAFVTGFFYLLLLNGVDYASQIVNSFIDIGNKALGYGHNEYTADKVLSAGFKICESAVNTSNGILDTIKAIPLYILALLIFIILILILANYIVEIASAWILIFGGYFVLAFGATQWTRDWVINYFKAVVGIGLKILTLIFLISIGVELIEKQVAIIDGGSFSINSGIVILATTILLYIIMNKVPDAVASLVSGAWGHISGINMAAAAATLMGASEVLQTSAQMMSKMGGAGVEGAKNFTSGVKDVIKENALKQAGNDQNNTFTNWNNTTENSGGLFSNKENENKNGSGLAYNMGRGAGKLGSALKGKLYAKQDDLIHDKNKTSYSTDKSDNTNNKTNDTTENSNSNT